MKNSCHREWHRHDKDNGYTGYGDIYRETDRHLI